MDILAHTLWANYGSRITNRIIKKKNKKEGKNIPSLNVILASFLGVFPDFFAFGIPFIYTAFQVITGAIPLSNFGSHHGVAGTMDLAANLYQYSHSLVVWAIVFVIVWIICKRPRYEMFGWALHILIDIPSHVISFFPTPFLFPISEYRFSHGISWGNHWYMIINYILLLVGFIWLMRTQKKSEKIN